MVLLLVEFELAAFIKGEGTVFTFERVGMVDISEVVVINILILVV